MGLLVLYFTVNKTVNINLGTRSGYPIHVRWGILGCLVSQFIHPMWPFSGFNNMQQFYEMLVQYY